VNRLLAGIAVLAAFGSAAIFLAAAPWDPSREPGVKAARGVDIGFYPMTSALSPEGQDYRQNLQVTYNGSCGAAIVTYTTLTGGLWAHYFDGKCFSPAVNIVPPDGSPTSVIGDRVCHAFINTKDNPSYLAAARYGDAVILFTAVDTDDDGAASADGQNRALYCAYFDCTYSTNAAHNYGFQTVATRISGRDGYDENVICHGIVSDGLIGEARWLNYQYRYKYGDQTTGLAAFWTQAENTDGDATVEDLATYGMFFNLAQSGPADAPLLPGSEIRIPTANFGASDTGASADQTRTESRYVVYNNVLIMRCAANAAGLGAEPDLWDFGVVMHQGDDVTLQSVAFNFSSRTIGAANVLQGVTPSATDTTENNAMPLRQDGSFLSGGHSTYGADEGLSRTLFFFTELANGQANVNWGTSANNARISAVELDSASGAVLGHEFLDDEDPSIFDSVGSTTADCRLSRNGDYAFVAWAENRNAGATTDRALWSAQVSTARGSGTPAPFVDRVSAPVPVNTDVDGAPMSWFAFQDGLEYVYGAQSNAAVMNVYYEQSATADDQVWGARLTADLTPAPTAATSSVSLLESFADGAQPGMGSINEEHWLFNGTDNGKDGSTIVFYGKLNPDSKAGFSLYSETTGTGAATSRIDRPHSFTQIDYQGLPLAMTPAGSSTALLGEKDASTKRVHAWTRVHIFWNEDRTKGLDDAGAGLYTRFWDATSTASSFADRFVPAAEKPSKGAAEPIQMDWEGGPTDLDDQPEIRGLARKTNQVGVWFAARDHLWYQEFAYGKKKWNWDVHGGSGHPLQMDDEAAISTKPRVYLTPSFKDPGPQAQTVGPMKAFFTHAGTANTLDEAVFFWIKDTLDDGFPLLFARVRNKD
jgi:hypothetical protein